MHSNNLIYPFLLGIVIGIIVALIEDIWKNLKG